jgi:uncharacterized DUF497 family protein
LSEINGIFYDDHAITIEDCDHDEERFVTLGMDDFGRLSDIPHPHKNF